MNRTVLIGAIVVLLAGTGYYQFVYKPQQEAAMIEEATKKAEEAAAAEAAATEAAAAEAAAAVEAEAAAAADAAAAAAAEGAAAVTEGAAAATDTAAAALDPANFDPVAVTALIDGSTLDDATKTTLKTAVDAAAANPALVADTVAQVRTALGL